MFLKSAVKDIVRSQARKALALAFSRGSIYSPLIKKSLLTHNRITSVDNEISKHTVNLLTFDAKLFNNEQKTTRSYVAISKHTNRKKLNETNG